MAIFFDIDGVLRDVVTPIFGKQDVFWDELTIDGKSIVQFIEENPSVLETAPAFDYIYVALEYEVNFLSCQPYHWRKYTNRWLHKHFPIRHLEGRVIYVTHAKFKMEYIKDGDILVEDYPHFENYNNIILVDRSYNQKTNASIRVYSPEELCTILSWSAKVRR